MDAYTSFAQVYDEFMDNIPYDEWTKYLVSLLKDNNISDGIIVDMGCGTGSVTRRLSDAGYDMIGIDNSMEMISIAMEKDSEKCMDGQILYLLQDMREMELYGTVKAAVSICDSMNYITDEEDMLEVFKLVNNYLDKDGVFIFDLNTVYKYKNILADNTIAENRDNESFIWENFFYDDEMINEYDLSIFIRMDEEDVYRKYQETHYQRAYYLDEIKELIKEAGMEFVAAYDAFTKEPVKEDSERIYIIAKEGYQEGKTYNE
jgi:ubiquinone/menaquinone biosynthesis C-methylase UbiE